MRRTARGSLVVLIASALAAAGATTGSLLAQDVSVRARVDQSRVARGEQVVLSVDVVAPSLERIAPPDISAIRDFTVASGPGVSQRFQWINGRTSASLTYTYVLLPRDVGTLTIPSLGLLIQGRTYRTRPLRVDVVAAPQGPGGSAIRPPTAPPVGRTPPAQPQPEAGQRGIDVRVRAEVDTRTAYVGQQVTARFLLDTRTEVLNLSMKDTPTFPGFWAEEIQVPENFEMRRVQIEGEPFTEYTLMKKALFPTSSGTLTIPGVAYQIQVRRRSLDPIESFFFTPTETVVRRTDPITVDVKPLPADGRPKDFSGAVGRFRLTVTADRSQAQVSDAIGVKLRLSGEGTLNAVTASPLPAISDFRQYDPKVSSSTSTQADRLRGEKVWDHVLIPLAPGDHLIPAVSFSFFDPEAAAYRMVSSEPIAIQVARGAGGTDGSYAALSQSDVRLLRRDIHFIKLARGGLHDGSRAFYRSTPFALLLLLPVAGNLATLVYARQRDRGQASQRARRERRARRAARRRLKEAGRQMTPSTSRAFYASIAQCLTGYMADKFDSAAAGLTHDRIEELLAGRGVSDDLRSAYHRCLEACDFARFAPTSSGQREMQTVLNKAEEILVALERSLGS